MNADLQTRLDALDSSLAALSETITSYAPSAPAARALLQADEELRASTDELTTHQLNHARLAALHSEATTLETKLRSALTDLASARTAVLDRAFHFPALPKDTRSVPLTELLSNAQSTARYAAPRGYVRPTKREDISGADAGGAADAGDAGPAGTAGAANPSNTAADKPTSSGVSPHTAAEAGPTQQSNIHAKAVNPALTALDPSVKIWLDPLDPLSYAPWPSEDMIARSGLARVQGWVGAEGAPLEQLQQELEQQPHQQQQGTDQGPLRADRGPLQADQGTVGQIGRGGAGDDAANEAEREAVQRARAAAAAREREDKPKVFMGMEMLGSDEDE